MQQTPTRGDDGEGSGFSTLYGSKWVATRRKTVKKFYLEKFQYPLRVEVGCNDS